MKRNIILVLAVVLMLGAFTGCGFSVTKSEEEQTGGQIAASKVKEADIKGVIEEISEDGTSILVDSESSLAKGLVWVSISEDTNFFENMDKDIAIGYRDISRDFQVGNTVEIIVEGGIAESYPMQAKAGAVCFNGVLEK